MRIITAILIVVFITATASAEKTTRKKLKLRTDSVTTEAVNIQYEEITVITDSAIIFTGYDKPIGADRESVFIINNSGQTIDKINITIDYFDILDRKLTSRTLNIIYSIPDKETRLVAFKTWDIQHSFYYYKSRKPRTQATPYKVTININKAFTKK